jgi:predicted MPP superfamily phosphohydrolase
MTSEIRRLAATLAQAPVDLIALTGDYADKPKDAAAAVATLEFLASHWRSRLGAVGIMGNHDSWEFRRAARRIPSIHWLTHENPRVQPLTDAPFWIWGFDEPEDLFGTVLAQRTRDLNSLGTLANPLPKPDATLPESGVGAGFHIALTHYPSEIYPAAELGFAVVLAGHTHGGQWRVSPRFAAHTSSDLPSDMAAGILRLRSTLALVSRGIGGSVVDLRVNCPAQAPVYELRRGELAEPRQSGLRSIERW